MRKLLVATVVLSLGVSAGRLGVAGPPPCATENGDVNGDGGRDLSDAINLLSHLFQGGPAPGLFCVDAGTGQDCAAANGDTNGDGGKDLSDVIYLLGWLFQGAPAPVPKCAVVIAGDPSRLPKTSTKQILCFDASDPAVEIPCTDATCPGQDGFYDLNGCLNNPRFVDNGDQTVTDTCTGLMWQKESGNGGAGLPWCDALEFCEVDLDGFAGFNDWRLPSIRELESIVDYGNGPAFDTAVFPNHSNAHWSSTSVIGSASNAWYVDFSGGQFKSNSGKQNPNRLRAVRGLSGLLLPDTGQTLCYDETGAETDCTTGDCFGQDGFYATGCSNTPRFIDNLNDTVTDTCTGLMWEKDTGNGGTTLEWCGALDYCEGLSFAGQNDWRLPNPRELHSLIDYGRHGPALDPLFSATAGTLSWASTSQIMNERNAWYVDVQGGRSDTSLKGTLQQVRAVRCEGPGVCPELVCDDNVDNDGDGLTDSDDPDCAEMICDDALDNDGDGLVDCDDPDCDSSGDCELICDDNVDNDGDGVTDCVDPNCAADPACQVSSSLLPRTTTAQPLLCYDEIGDPTDCTTGDCFGQDGFYEAGCSANPRFVSNDSGTPGNASDDTVMDNCTGLMWQKISSDGGAGFSWRNALEHCEVTLDGFAGFNDWRLPSIRELESIVDYDRPAPYDETAFPAHAAAHWSSTSVTWPAPGFNSRAWYVNFSSGQVQGTEKINPNRVRAVRGVSGLLLPDTGQTRCYDDAQPPNEIGCTDATFPGQDGFYAAGCSNTPRFNDNLDDTVTDTCTGLMWETNAGNGGAVLSWCGALAYCEESSVAGHTDWRLPNARELHSLLDYGRHGPALDPLFNAGAGPGPWASTSVRGLRTHAWLVDIQSVFEGGTSNIGSKDITTTFHVRAVRDAP